MIGQTISHYRIVEKLGEGGMGVVYKAEDENLHRLVALKFLRPEALGDRQTRGRFSKEAEAAAALDHPNITTVYEIGEADGQTFIAMALVEGENLATKIQQRPLPLDEALRIASEIGDALQAAHEKGVVHRDIKPSNIMITAKGRVKVMDFGLAHLAGQTRITRTGTIMGTPAYMSPEQAQGKTADQRSDIWSLGVVLYEMVTGRLPFQGENEQSVLLAIINQEPEAPTALRTGIPLECDRIVGKLLAKEPDARYPHVEDLLVDLRAMGQKPDSGLKTKSGIPGGRQRLSAAHGAVALFLMVATALGTWLVVRQDGQTRKSGSPPALTRMTANAGLTYQPAISPDARLIAYSSDRAGEGNLDIWVQQVAGGQPIRLTTDDADETEPAFSPDGSQIAFRSEKDGGGIYVVSALGGDVRLITPDGRRPRFSPDGAQLAFWVGTENTTARRGSRIYVMPSSGGEARELQRGRSPVWLPGGQHLLFAGRSDGEDWWVTSLEGGEPIAVGALDAFSGEGIRNIPEKPIPIPDAYLADTGRVVFSARVGDSVNVWQVPLSNETWRITGPAVPLTMGIGFREASVANDRSMVMSSLMVNHDLFSLPLDANQGRARDEPERLTTSAADDEHPDVSLDGKRLAFVSRRSGNWDIWITEIGSGKLSALTTTPHNEFDPIISADGTKVGYRTDGARIGYQTAEGSERALYVLPTTGGLAETVYDSCYNATGWSSSGDRVLCDQRDLRISVVTLASREKATLAQDSEDPIYDPRFSPDDQWIAFHRLIDGYRRQLFIVPVRPGSAPKQEDWIQVTDGSGSDCRAAWSPDGNLLYFLSDRDGFRCIWAQRLDDATKQPDGTPFGVYHSHLARLSIRNVPSPNHVGLSVALDKVVFTMAEITGNVWLMEPDRE